MVLNYIAPDSSVLVLHGNRDFVLSEVDGLTDLSTSISATDVAAGDGTTVNYVRSQPRGIVMYISIPLGKNVELVKRSILSVIKPKQTGLLHWEQQGRELEIEATVENISMPRYTEQALMQITFYCAQPYWQDAEFIVQQLANIDPLHHFELVIPQGVGFVMGEYNIDLTKAFTNYGDASVGCTVSIIATGAVTNPLLERSDGLFFGLNVTMQAGDEIVINTAKGKKSVYKNGVSIIDKVKPGSTWLQLETGENIFTISEANGATNMYFNFSYKQKYV